MCAAKIIVIENIAESIGAGLEKIAGHRVFVEFSDFGDISTSLPLRIAKKEGRNPEEVAGEIAEKLKFPGVDTKTSGGFINFTLSEKLLIENLKVITKFKPANKVAVVEYSSPNIAKPFSVGHLRSTVIGESLRRILNTLGWRTEGLNFIGDWGTQFGKLLAAYHKWPTDLKKEPIKELLRIYVRFHEEAAKNPELEEDAREWFRRLENGDEEATRIWKKFRELSMGEFDRMYSLLGTSELGDASESLFVKRGHEIADELLEKGIATRDRGAVVVPVEGKPPLILRKSDGTTIYASRDLVSAIERYEKFRPDLMLYVVGNDQKLHFHQLISVMKKVGIKADAKHVSFGMMSLPEGKMSTRRGRVVFLEDVLNEGIERVRKIMKGRGIDDDESARRVGIGAVKFADLKTNRVRDVVFDWNMLSFEGETGPYVQYAAVRAKRIGEKFGRGKPGIDGATEVLARKLLRFRIAVLEASRQLRPDLIANYLLDLSKNFNELYARERFGGVPEREWLAGKVHEVLENGLWLLGIEVPEIM